MMILKYIIRQRGDSCTKPIGFTDESIEYMVPKGGIILSAGLQRGLNICVWILIPDTCTTHVEKRTFRYFATGEAFQSEYQLNFIATVVDVNNEVWHVFEEVHNGDEPASPSSAQIANALEDAIVTVEEESAYNAPPSEALKQTLENSYEVEGLPSVPWNSGFNRRGI